LRLIEAILATGGTDSSLDPLYDEAIRDTIAQCEATESPVTIDGEQRTVPQLLDNFSGMIKTHARAEAAAQADSGVFIPAYFKSLMIAQSTFQDSLTRRC
jgi:hypothetical protein